MPTWMPEIIREHWRALLAGWIAVNFIQTMPSPTEKGQFSSPLYKWGFAFLHGVGAALPRVVYTMAPQLVKFLPFNGQTQPPNDKSSGSGPLPPAPPATA